MTDFERYIQMAHITHQLREPALRDAIVALNLPAGSSGLDAGCGIGLQSVMLAEYVGPAGHVTGLDLSAESVQYAESLVSNSGSTECIDFKQGDVAQLPFENDTFDWAWSADCVGYAPMEPLPLIKELARVVKPGGSVAILAWSSEKLLPGYPQLEARLAATTAGIAPFQKSMEPEKHFLRALGWFKKLGLQDCSAKTFTGNVQAPLSPDIRKALQELFKMRWPSVESELSQNDFAVFKRLCFTESPDFILNHPDYYAFFNYSMFFGRV